MPINQPVRSLMLSLQPPRLLLALEGTSPQEHRYACRVEANISSDGGAPMTVWIYVDTSKQVGDKDHPKVFADEDVAGAWFADHDSEGVAFEYEIAGTLPGPVSR